MALFDFFTKVIGVDPGTSYLRIVHGNQIVFDEPNRISVDKSMTKVTGFGKSATSNSNNILFRPVNYTVSDFHGFEMLLRSGINKGVPNKWILPPSIIGFWAVPSNVTEVDKRAYRDAAEHANAKEVYMLHQNCAAAISLHILFEKKHFVLVDIGASKIEVSVFNDSIPVGSFVFRLGIDKIAQILKNHLRRNHELVISESDAFELLAALEAKSDSRILQFKEISINELNQALQHFFYLLNDEVLHLCETIPVNSLDKALKNGIYFTGGGSRFDYLRKQICFERGGQAHISKTPWHDNINGLAKVMADKKKFKNYLMT